MTNKVVLAVTDKGQCVVVVEEIENSDTVIIRYPNGRTGRVKASQITKLDI